MELRGTDKFSADLHHVLRRRENRDAQENREVARTSGDRLEVSREAARKLEEERRDSSESSERSRG